MWSIASKGARLTYVTRTGVSSTARVRAQANRGTETDARDPQVLWPVRRNCGAERSDRLYLGMHARAASDPFSMRSPQSHPRSELRKIDVSNVDPPSHDGSPTQRRRRRVPLGQITEGRLGAHYQDDRAFASSRRAMCLKIRRAQASISRQTESQVRFGPIPGVRTLRPSSLALALLLLTACGSEGQQPGVSLSGPPLRTQSTQKSVESSRSEPPNLDRVREQLQARLDRHGGDLERLAIRDHATRVPLQRRFGHAVAARRGADGRIEYGCFDDAEVSAHFLNKASPEVRP